MTEDRPHKLTNGSEIEFMTFDESAEIDFVLFSDALNRKIADAFGGVVIGFDPAGRGRDFTAITGVHDDGMPVFTIDNAPTGYLGPINVIENRRPYEITIDESGRPRNRHERRKFNSKRFKGDDHAKSKTRRD